MLWLVPYSRNENFIGRGDIVERLAAVSWETHQRIVLYGLGGIGKTQIAIQYAYSLRSLSKPPSVFWVHGSDRERFLQDYREIHRISKLPKSDEGGGSDGLQNIILTKKWLESQESGDWVFILDNADDLLEYYPNNAVTEKSPNGKLGISNLVPQGSKGVVLITIRDFEVARRISENKNLRIHVQNMSHEEAVSLLQSKCDGFESPNDEEIFESLFSKLEYLPLAISQAAAYISSLPGTTIQRYLDLFQKHRVKLLGREFVDLRRDPTSQNTITRTWLISFKQIQSQCPLASNLLKFIAFLDRQKIPEDLLKASGFEGVDDDFDFPEALQKLVEFSLITSPTEKVYEVHRLVYLATYESIPQEEKEILETKALNAVLGVFPNSDVTLYSLSEIYRAHALHILGRVTSSPSPEREEQAKALVRLSNRVACYLEYSGQLKIARNLLEKSLAWSEKYLCQTDNDVLTSLFRISIILQAQGKLDEAAEMCQRVLDGRLRILGPDHPDTLGSFNNMSIILQAQGKLDGAAEMCQRVLDGRLRILGPNHPATLESFNNMSIILQAQEKLDEAAEMCQRVLDGRLRILGSDHLDTLGSFEYMSTILQGQGKLDEAAEMCRRVLDGFSKVLGPNHPNTLKCSKARRTILQKQRECDEAKASQYSSGSKRGLSSSASHEEDLSRVRRVKIQGK